MPRRFSDEPINLIHRIPTPEQLSAARPSKRSFSQALVESGAACVRTLGDLFSHMTRMGRMAKTEAEPMIDSPGRRDVSVSEAATDTAANWTEEVRRSPATEPSSHHERDLTVPGSAAMPMVQPEEVAELRAYLLSQQQDIARLSGQIQELKSMVVSQQQVLVYLGKELEISSLAPMTAGIASAPAKRNRPVRDKSGMKDKTVARKDAPASPSLSL